MAAEIVPAAVLVEPEPGNIAPAILAAAPSLIARDPQAALLVLPYEPGTPEPELFRAALQAASPRAVASDLVTLAIRRNRPETGYGFPRLVQDEVCEGPRRALLLPY